MLSLMDHALDLDAAAAQTIAAGMREIAAIDGAHAREDALIDAFASGLPAGAGSVDLTSLPTDDHKEAFMKSLVLVAFADGQLSAGERAVIERYATELGLDASTITGIVTHVASVLLSKFAGVKVYRDQVAEIGKGLGLDDETISSLLG